MNHISVLDELVNGPFADEMSPEAKRLWERHRKEHVAAAYLQEKGATRQ
jgi:hypothetical protein